ncbi:transcriptional regulator [Enterococcus casseliflavus]|nr:transcriptional regulator [Enterococcus casseliflavus]
MKMDDLINDVKRIPPFQELIRVKGRRYKLLKHHTKRDKNQVPSLTQIELAECEKTMHAASSRIDRGDNVSFEKIIGNYPCYGEIFES